MVRHRQKQVDVARLVDYGLGVSDGEDAEHVIAGGDGDRYRRSAALSRQHFLVGTSRRSSQVTRDHQLLPGKDGVVRRCDVECRSVSLLTALGRCTQDGSENTSRSVNDDYEAEAISVDTAHALGQSAEDVLGERTRTERLRRIVQQTKTICGNARFPPLLCQFEYEPHLSSHELERCGLPAGELARPPSRELEQAEHLPPCTDRDAEQGAIDRWDRLPLSWRCDPSGGG
ncbi:hypothetical protein AMJ71_00660 [candidate division TA06 bacterium SM1_40]|uniref:Uncharacterized protein n=1 Tax=candidate division TA06 bacterium SM1_40 TaxID=1703773 RepID=A0A0S8JRS3_UNCT6|nr:MAG: hypothetical protein AMJ71_00660 [candidate division TA06 bacterium SM1_40]